MDAKKGDIKTLQNGTPLLKIRHKKTYRRFFYVARDMKHICYRGSRKFGHSTVHMCKLNDIDDIREGKLTDALQKLKPKPRDEFCFSLIRGKKSYDFIARNSDERNAWVTGLRKLLKQKMPIHKDYENIRKAWIARCFRKADRSKDGRLTRKEVVDLMDAMNAGIDKVTISEMFDKANFRDDKDEHGRDVLDLEEFVKFYELLTYREELEELFKSYTGGGEDMSAEVLKTFLETEQKVEKSIEDCEKLIKEFDPCQEDSDQTLMTVEGFKKFLLSESQCLFNVAHRLIYQDMTLPLQHYFINSSHNTYLTEDQLKGPSSVEGYIRALQKGCRCVELDCWDGPNNEPIIYHGHTLTSKILFKDAIVAIKNFAFVASKYPVILSLENHCSVPQQTVMAKHMKTILGDTLYSPPGGIESLKEFPSPEDLIEKIIIKGKKLPADVVDEGDVSDEDEAEEMAEVDENVQTEVQKKSTEKVKLSKELSDLVMLKGVSMKSFEHSRKNYKFYEMSSIAEVKGLGLVDDDALSFTRHCAFQLVRTYPKGGRIDSSNYKPHPFWTVGAQIVALNFQTTGAYPMRLYLGKFQDNGGCGYILKPTYMQKENTIFDPNSNDLTKFCVPLKYVVTVLSAQQLPKPQSASEKSEIIDPYVKVSVKGIPSDCQAETTNYVSNNGLNPIWKHKAEFKIRCPDLAVIMFTIRDKDKRSGDEFIGYNAFPVTSMQPGYRHVELLTKHGDHIPMASLFVHLEIIEE
ncbi:1-phosphatidylinositol 4,5-bisphosphate phosphodiesterase delta-4 isoform X2 [Lingula anatina]|uniref:Phosphoinositide phospholipase C n=1 Tax=Lingula anatina TaxID=7574 RepID=A0A2R2MNZ7_LINAN|nr:1-phosphatidylinositol 4,5-bisphosphate phosphodiesterase delta-4 isoform X2 [Lingula anatina]|eukprot:XP_023931951.1 1-phosphatidylinositol 4,5-bisphosphate phosphodiesterase delta-4 isoform X2 [Lingula anatina]